MKYLTALLVYATAGGAAMVLRAHVVVALWSWFVMPFGVHAIETFQAMGLTLLVGLLTDHNFERKKDEDDEHTPAMRASQQATKSIVLSLLLWGVGALLHANMP